MSSVGAFPQGNSMYGIFYYLKEIDGKFLSKYSVEAIVDTELEYVYNYFSTDDSNYFTVSNKIIKITFKEPFVLTDYSFANSGTSSAPHTYPKAWEKDID